jgi:hypothetical protein
MTYINIMTSRVSKYDIEKTTNIHENIWCPLENNHKKRKRCNNYNLRNSATSSNETIDTYISGTRVKNFLLRDPLLDWFDMYYVQKETKRTKVKNSLLKNKEKELQNTIDEEKNKMNVLFTGGNTFENKVMDHIEKKYKKNVVTISEGRQCDCTYENFEKTKKAMMNGVPIISQAILINDKNNTRGIADIIVRSDYLNKIVTRRVISDENKIIKAPFLNGNYHYRVIDIKWTSMTLCSNGYTIRNEGRFPCYKGQLAIYNCILGEIQGFFPSEAYILAKSWKIDRAILSEEGDCCFDLLGVIDYDGFDNQYIEKTKNAMNWIRELRIDGDKWDPLNPHRVEMYPNMSNKNDTPWTNEKQKIANEINELTQIWYVGDVNRNHAHAHGITSWKDERCTSEIMKISGTKRAHTINTILDVNRNDNVIIHPKFIKNNLCGWQTESPVDFYIDFETLNCALCDTTDINIYDSKKVSDLVFMIGIGYKYNNKWIYKNFTINSISFDEEIKIFDEFTDFLKTQIQILDPERIYMPRLFHWSQAELINLRHVNERHDNKWKNLLNDKIATWVDMYNVFTDEPIVVKGSLSFKLKSVGKSLYNLGLIPTSWNDIGPSDGLDAMMSAIECYMKNKNVKRTQVMKMIIDYNEVDCKIILDIVELLRDNNCD